MYLKVRIKKAVAFLMFFTLVLGMSANIGVSAKETTKAEKFEAMLKTVKERVKIPEELSEFDYQIHQDGNGLNKYYLQWENSVRTASITVNADENGNIFSYYFGGQETNQEHDKKQITYLMKELKDEAKKIAETLNPCTKDHLKFSKAEYNTYSGSYAYTFIRQEHGIPMENQVTVILSAIDKSLISYETNWAFDVVIPSVDRLISKAKAVEIANKNLSMTLKYMTDYSWDETQRKLERSIFLAYVPSKDYLAIDAKTGKAYEEHDVYNYYNEFTINKDEVDTNESYLTPEEIKKIDTLESLLSKDEAVKLIKNDTTLYLDQRASKISGRLYKRNEKYCWNISFSAPWSFETEDEREWIPTSSATVNAETGELLYFNTDLYGREDPKGKLPTLLSKEQAIKKAEAFLYRQGKKYCNDVKAQQKVMEDLLIHPYYDDIASVTLGYGYQYIRMVNKVPYEDNGVNISVDRMSGKIYHYLVNWNEDLKFASTEHIISAEKAKAAYLNGDVFKLIYEYGYINENEDAQKQTVRLVYNTRSNGYYYISPFTGDYINTEGERVSGLEEMITAYRDIKGNPYERNIQILADAGYGYQKGMFYPNKGLTLRELVKMMHAVGLFLSSEQMEKISDQTVTREEFAKLLITACGYDTVANLNSIFTTGYEDEEKIAPDAKGSVAIMKGLGLYGKTDSKTFGPKEIVKRDEAANLLVKIMMVDRR